MLTFRMMRSQTFFSPDDAGGAGDVVPLEVGFDEQGGEEQEFGEEFVPVFEEEQSQQDDKGTADSVGVQFLSAMQQQMQTNAQLVQSMQQLLQQIPTMVHQSVSQTLGQTNQQAPVGDDIDKYFSHLQGNSEDADAAKSALKPLVKGMMQDMMGEIQRLRQELSTKDATNMRFSVEQQLLNAVEQTRQRAGVKLFSKGDLTEYMTEHKGLSIDQAARQLEAERLREMQASGFRRQTKVPRASGTPFPRAPGGGGITTNRSIETVEDLEDYIDKGVDVLMGRLGGQR